VLIVVMAKGKRAQPEREGATTTLPFPAPNSMTNNYFVDTVEGNYPTVSRKVGERKTEKTVNTLSKQGGSILDVPAREEKRKEDFAPDPPRGLAPNPTSAGKKGCRWLRGERHYKRSKTGGKDRGRHWNLEAGENKN